uniref:Poly [ADP-ribose] polymerase n=1 Tax=Ciona savignyi TaxID=51511 RepID=H2YRT1_CIOSA
FHTTAPGFQVIKVEQIQNQTLYRQYAAKREEVRNHVTQGVQVEQELFHGTTEDVCEKIWKGGFNRSYAGKNGTRLGDGVYFSTSAQYSNSFAGYATPKHMFVADVLTGNYTNGQSGLKEPPIKPGTQITYDSVVDNISNPSMYAVFKDASAYPSYLITYQ